jgi:hypothetical protein
MTTRVSNNEISYNVQFAGTGMMVPPLMRSQQLPLGNLSRIAEIDWHEIASSAPPVPGVPMLLLVHRAAALERLPMGAVEYPARSGAEPNPVARRRSPGKQ